MARNYHQGFFKPLNPKKYKGDPTQIVYRSGWERIVFKWLDQHSSCIEWGSEEFFIPYRSPVDDKVHRYFPDVLATFKYPTGEVKTYLIEIKPYKETLPPETSGKTKKRLLEETATYAVNQSKWEQAKKYCEAKGWHFKIMTEFDIGVKKKGK